MAYGLYTSQTWTDGSGSTPLSAARMGNIETGVFNAFYAPAVRVFHNAAQSSTTGVALVLAFNSERYDQAGNAADTMHDTVTNNSRLTCRYAGIYRITGNIEFGANSTGIRQAQIRLNGTTIIANEVTSGAPAGAQQVLVTTEYALQVNDYVELLAIQNSGGSLNVNSSANYSPEFMMSRAG